MQMCCTYRKSVTLRNRSNLFRRLSEYKWHQTLAFNFFKVAEKKCMLICRENKKSKNEMKMKI